jgi:hypothetical protein
VKPKDVRRALLSIPVPDELDAQRRAWAVVQAAFAERERIWWPRRHSRPILAFAVVAALLAAALTPPGRAVVREVRDLIGREEVGRKDAAPALFRLPAAGRLLVTSARGVWLVQRDGSKRLLGRYRDATFSPTGRFVAVARRNELVALEPAAGELQWSLPRRDVRSPRWHGSVVDTRIAYLSGRNLRVVPGDGTGDKLLAKEVHPIAPAWRPGSNYVLALSDPRGRVHVYATETRGLLGRSRGGEAPLELEWAPSGRRLVALSPRTIRILDVRGRLHRRLVAPPGAVNVAVAWRGDAFALVRWHPSRRQSEVVLVRRGRARSVFKGSGKFTDVVWSPDRRWLLLAWQGPDQWLFIRSGVREVEAVRSISAQFRSRTFPALEGWCCP